MTKFELSTSVKYINELIGEWVWIKDNDRGWAKVTGYYNYGDGEGFRFTWAQYDVGPDITEIWDEGDFGVEDIDTKVLIGDDAKKASEELDKLYEEAYLEQYKDEFTESEAIRAVLGEHNVKKSR